MIRRVTIRSRTSALGENAHRRPGILASAVVALAVVAWSAAGVALSGATVVGGGSISVHGPSKNVYHTYFNETVTGSATGAANYVISGEQLNPSGGCATSYRLEATRTDWYQWPTGTGAVHGAYRLVARFWARNHAEHGICTYLVNRTTRATYAHAALFWNNS